VLPDFRCRYVWKAGTPGVVYAELCSSYFIFAANSRNYGASLGTNSGNKLAMASKRRLWYAQGHLLRNTDALFQVPKPLIGAQWVESRRSKG
jgi:hypothetical protein